MHQSSAAATSVLVCAVVTLIGLAGLAQVPQRSVLSLYGGGQDAVAMSRVAASLRRGIRDGLRGNLDYYAEFLDLARFGEPNHLLAAKDFLRSKYEGRTFDLIVATGDTEVEFLSRYRDVLFPDTPIVFNTAAPVEALPNSTGILSRLNIGNTLDTALRIQPDTQRVVVVSGASAYDKYYETTAREQFKPFEGRVAFTYLTGLPMRDLLRRVAMQPPHSIIFFVLLAEDGEGRRFDPTEMVGAVSAAANVPTYMWLNEAFGRGIVGGKMLSSEAVALRLSDLALRVLNGERADTIPITEFDWGTNLFDWRQLQRWGISESRLPVGSVVQFRPPAVWDQYKVYIVGATSLVALQTALIFGMVVQRVRRRRAEIALRQLYEQNQDLAGRLINAQEAERTRIARDLHDDVSQQLANLGIMLSGLKRRVGTPGSHADIDQEVTTLQDRTSALAEAVRNLSHELHPSVLQHVGLVSTLGGHCAEIERHHHIKVTFSAADDLDSLNPDVAICLFRVAQEALGNAVRHSRAQTMLVQLKSTDEGVKLEIIDDGVGFVPSERKGTGLGLRSMDERVRLMGGTVTVESRRGRGTTLMVRIPLAAAQFALTRQA